MASNSTLVPLWPLCCSPACPHRLRAAVFGGLPFFASSTPCPVTSHELQTNQRTSLRFQSLDSRIRGLYTRMLGHVLPLRPPKGGGRARSPGLRKTGMLGYCIHRDTELSTSASSAVFQNILMPTPQVTKRLQSTALRFKQHCKLTFSHLNCTE